MAPVTKIATCCYCGTRAALVLKGEARHELACATCGAPLHEMKMLRRDASASKASASPKVAKPRPSGGRSKARGLPRHEDLDPKPYAPPKRRKPAKVKRRKGLMARMFEEAFDVIEDIFD